MTNHLGGFECELAEEPPRAVQYQCPVCLLVLREPFQVNCCGYGFCQVCIEKIKVHRKPCPCCMAEDFDHFHDKRLKRSLSELKVNCVKENEGCDWTGELGDLEGHLNFSPSQEKKLKGCKFVQIPCSHCSKPTERSDIQTHQDHCPRRPFSCEYCEEYDSHYEDVTTNHWPVCGYYLVSCPNECGVTFHRRNLENHIANTCRLTYIDCDFKHAGCNVRLLRKDMPAHLNESTVTHLSLQAVNYKKEMMRLEAENSQMRQQMIEYQQQVDSCTRNLKNLEDELKQQVEKLTKDLQTLLQPKKKAAQRRWKVSYE